MPFLSWKEETLSQELIPKSDGFVMTLALSPEHRKVLLASLTDVFARPRSELRLELPQDWVIFWKLREGDSRLLIAHPAETEWVATVALGASDAEAFLTDLNARTEIPLKPPTGRGFFTSNFELVLTDRK